MTGTPAQGRTDGTGRMATDRAQAREAEIGRLLASQGVTPGRHGAMSFREFADWSGFGRETVTKFFKPIEPGERRHYREDTAETLGNLFPVIGVTRFEQAVNADTAFVVGTNVDALQRVLDLLPRLSRADTAIVMQRATERLASPESGTSGKRARTNGVRPESVD